MLPAPSARPVSIRDEKDAAIRRSSMSSIPNSLISSNVSSQSPLVISQIDASASKLARVWTGAHLRQQERASQGMHLDQSVAAIGQARRQHERGRVRLLQNRGQLRRIERRKQGDRRQASLCRRLDRSKSSSAK